MKKLVNLLLTLIVIVAVVSALLFYTYRVQIVQLIVSKDLEQKAPPNYPKEMILHEFSISMELVKKGALDKKTYLAKLFEISHRLEKDQRLTRDEVDKILSEIRHLRRQESLIRHEQPLAYGTH